MSDLLGACIGGLCRVRKDLMDSRILTQGSDVPTRNNSEHISHIAHSKLGFRPLPSKLYVITPIFNPSRYRVRYELYRQFAKHMEESGVILITVELALHDHPFEVTEADNPLHVQLRTDHVLWYKEPLINVGLRYLPKDWEYVAWIDADTKFTRDDWAQETIRLLQHYQLIQMWSQIQDLSPDFEIMNSRGSYINSFMYNYCNGIVPSAEVTKHQNPYPERPTESKKASSWYGPPGLAWAARREAIDHLGGVIDWAIVGSGDSYMASALIGGVQHQLRQDYHPEYVNQFLLWQTRAERFIRRNVGYMSGVCLHYFHGKKVRRQYVSRNKILTRNAFNPVTDLKRDWQGLYQLCDHGDERSLNLRDDLRGYFNQRNEDSVDI
jgi:hypothetical protein